MKNKRTGEITQTPSAANAVFSGVFWKFSERILAQGVSFIVSLVLARILLPDDYGVIAIVLVFISFADVFVVSGFSTSLIQKKDADDMDFSTIFYCSLVVSIILYFLIFLLSRPIAIFFKMPILSNVLKVFGLRIPLGSYNSIQHAFVSRNMLFKKFFFSTLFGTIASGIAGIYFAFKGFGVWALVIQYLTNSLVDSMILTFTVSWHPKLLFSWNSVKSLMGYGWKILAASLMGVTFENLRNILVGKFYTPTDLAYYNKGQQFPSLISGNISASIMSVLFPALSNKSDDIIGVKRMLRRSVQVSSYLMFPLLFGMAAVAKPMVNILLTEKWLPSVPFIQILCLSSALGLIGSTSLQGITAVGQSGAGLRLEFVKKPVYLFLLILGLKINVLAVAVTLLVYSFYANIANASTLRKYIGYGFREQIADIMPATLLSVASCGICCFASLLPLAEIFILLIQIAVAVIIYIFLSRIFKIKSYSYLLNFARARRSNEQIA